MENEYSTIMRLVGERLSGKRLIVRERIPGTVGLLGEIHRDLNGVLTIDISPEIKTGEKRLDVFLHEVGHAKCHTYQRSNHSQADPASEAKEQLDNWDRRREVTAENQAAAWKAYSRKHANPTLTKIDPFLADLIALIAYPEEGKNEL